MSPTRSLPVSGIHCLWRDTRGVTLPLSLMFLTAVGILGATAVLLITTDVLTGGNFKLSAQAFYAAEAGLQEARARLRANAGANQINDTAPTNAAWRRFIGSSAKAQTKGYSSEDTNHARVDSFYLASNYPLDPLPLDYTVLIQHATDGAGNVLYWGDSNGDGLNTRNSIQGRNIYVITSDGSMARANKTLEIEAASVPSPSIPAALYVETLTTMSGQNSTNIIGTNGVGCGPEPDVTGVLTTQAAASVLLPSPATCTDNPNLCPNITGKGGGPNPPDVVYNGTDINVQAVVDSLKTYANFSYTVNTASHTSTTTPGPGQNWGQPTPGLNPQQPSSCTANNIVHYKTGGTSIELKNGVSGCGILLVEGNLIIRNTFSWYGMIIVTGVVSAYTENVTLTQQITGAVMAGGSVGNNSIGLNTNIAYCGDAISKQTQNLPLLVFRWKEQFD